LLYSHRIVGVKLHRSLNYALLCIMSSEILAPPRKHRSGHPAGHPKLLQLETPLSVTAAQVTYALPNTVTV